MPEQHVFIIRSIRTNLYFARAFSIYNRRQAIKYLRNARNDVRIYKELIQVWNEDVTKTMVMTVNRE